MPRSGLDIDCLWPHFTVIDSPLPVIASMVNAKPPIREESGTFVGRSGDQEYENEGRCFSIGYATNGSILVVIYLWSNADTAVTKIRLLSARHVTQTEIQYYQEGL